MLAVGSLALISLFLIDSRHQERGAATLLPAPLLKVPAFGAGIAVQLAFSAAMSGSVLVLASGSRPDSTGRRSGPGWS